jgi:hypothetical protein
LALIQRYDFSQEYYVIKFTVLKKNCYLRLSKKVWLLFP